MTENSSLSTVKSPRDYGLPYDTFWPGQQEAIEGSKALLKEKDIVFLVSDTGTGKTGIATAIANAYSTASVLAPTIALERQYGQITGLEYGMGRQHHKCYNGMDALKCMQLERCEGPCEYKAHINRIRMQKIRVFNYAQFMAINAGKNKMPSQLVVCDEGHGIEEHIQSFTELWFKGETPVWGSEYKNLLFDYGSKFLIMSAHVIPALVAETMGFGEDEYAVYEAQNNFDPNRNPVFCRPVGYITHTRPLTDRIVRAIDGIVGGAIQNGIIHTSSDRQTEEIIAGSKYSHKFIWPKGKSRATQIELFKNAEPGTAVLISAGMYEGQDFPDDECRWQIITKVPYASLGSPVVRARREQRPDLYRLAALQKIQQMCGRGWRNPEDWCINYILDSTAIKLFEEYGHLLSSKFQATWKGVQF